MASELHQRQRHAKYEADVELESEERRDERVVVNALHNLLRKPRNAKELTKRLFRKN